MHIFKHCQAMCLHKYFERVIEVPLLCMNDHYFLNIYLF